MELVGIFALGFVAVFAVLGEALLWIGLRRSEKRSDREWQEIQNAFVAHCQDFTETTDDHRARFEEFTT